MPTTGARGELASLQGVLWRREIVRGRGVVGMPSSSGLLGRHTQLMQHAPNPAAP